ncbi:MAG: hypothetical protein Q9160_000011 [Pyrenula sp. 1 TL-2023]
MTPKIHLLTLPPEILADVGRRLASFDLFELCLTSKACAAVFRAILYENVRLRVSQQRLRNSDSYRLVPRHDGLRYTKILTIINSWSEKQFFPAIKRTKRQQTFEEDEPSAEGYYEDLYNRSGKPANASRYQDLSTTLNGLVQAQIVRIPPGRLQSFRSIGLNGTIESVDSIIKASSSTLRSLTLGEERLWLMSALSHNRVPNIPNILKDFGYSSWQALQLERLKLVCLDLDFGSTPSLAQRTDFSRLTRLSLLSCPGSVELLIALTAKFGASGQSNALSIKEFRFRIEHPPQQFTHAVEAFLQSFSGLKVLSVLVDGIESNRMPDVDYFLNRHASSLEVLVWEGRKHKGVSQGDSDYTCTLGSLYDPESQFCKLLKRCKNLLELSIPYEWKGAGPHLSDDEDNEFPTMILNTKLRTLHIRNSPLKDSSTTKSSELIHATLAIAQEFLREALNDRHRKYMLELLIIGPLTFHHHREWQFKPGQRSRFPQYRLFPAWNRPNLFIVEKHCTQFHGTKVFADQLEFESVYQLKHAFGFHVEALKSIML